MIRWTRVLLTLFSAGLSSPLDALEIRDVEHQPRYVASARPGPVAIAAQFSGPAYATVKIYDGSNVLIRELKIEQLGDYSGEVQWDLTGNDGQQVPEGVYSYRIDAANGEGESASWDLWDTTGGRRLAVEAAGLTQGQSAVSYVMPATGLVRIRIGLDAHGPLLKTLVNWVPRLEGPHSEFWDGFDESGVVALRDHPRLDFRIDAVELPKNSIVVGQPEKRVRASVNPLAARRPSIGRSHTMHNYLRQAVGDRGDVPARLSVRSTGTDPKGRPTVSGIVPVRVELAADDRKRLEDQRFEAVFFVDGLFAFEMESAYFPVTWRWDTTRFNPGTHYVTANLRGYEGQFAIATIEVLVER